MTSIASAKVGSFSPVNWAPFHEPASRVCISAAVKSPTFHGARSGKRSSAFVVRVKFVS